MTVLKIFAIFTRKQLCWCLFLIKLHPATLLKRDSKAGAFLRILRNFSVLSCYSSLLFTIIFKIRTELFLHVQLSLT